MIQTCGIVIGAADERFCPEGKRSREKLVHTEYDIVFPPAGMKRILEVMQIVMVELDARQIWNSAVRIFQKIAHGYFHA